MCFTFSYSTITPTLYIGTTTKIGKKRTGCPKRFTYSNLRNILNEITVLSNPIVFSLSSKSNDFESQVTCVNIF